MKDLTQLISKYRGFIRDPEGSAPEIMDLFFVRDEMEHDVLYTSFFVPQHRPGNLGGSARQRRIIKALWCRCQLGIVQGNHGSDPQ